MSDFLERFGEQLRLAEHRQFRAAPAGGAYDQPQRRRLTRRNGLLALVAALVVAAPAAALVAPWKPTVGRPGISEPTLPPSSAPVSPVATEALVVLRREQTATDRAIATPLLTALGQPIGGVQLNAVRALSDKWILAPAEVVDGGRGNQVCITDGKAIGCSNAAGVDKHGVNLLSANASRTRLVGLVPDRVARVRFVTSNGTETEVTAHNNFYSLSVAETMMPPTKVIPAPKDPQYKGPAMIPAPPIPVAGTLQWLDAAGRVVGPQHAR